MRSIHTIVTRRAGRDWYNPPMDIPQHAKENAWQSGLRSLKNNTAPSFRESWKLARKTGHYAPFVFKTSCTVAGAALMADGIYNFVVGSQEQVEDALFSDKSHMNFVRMITGLGEIGGGALVLYGGLTRNGQSFKAV